MKNLILFLSFIFILPYVHAQVPGNALNFDGVNDYVRVLDATILRTDTMTIEMWIKPHASNGPILNKPNSLAVNGSYNIFMSGNSFSVSTVNNGNYKTIGSSAYTQGQWYHLVAVFQPNRMALYVNGILVSASSTGFSIDHSASPLIIGANPALNSFGSFSMDELRIFSTNRESLVDSDMRGLVATTAPGFSLYYDFDQGIGGANNSGNTIMVDQTINNNYATLYNFGLVGSTSNWVNSYAIVVPIIKSATNIIPYSFLARWSPPITGSFTNYLLDVSLSGDFSSFVSGYNSLNVGNDTSFAVTGLLSKTTYYYRVRANNTGMNGQGSYSDKRSLSTPYASPVITSFTNDTSYAGETIVITGEEFKGITSVKFGDSVASSFLVISPTQIDAVINNVRSGAVTVTNSAGTGSRSGFVFLLPPTITSFTPTSVSGLGDTIIITGTNFERVQSVSFGGIQAAFTVISINTIKAVIQVAISGNASVTTIAGTATRSGFTFTPTSISGTTSICKGGNTILTATGVTPLQWYDAATGGNLLFTGAVYISPALNNNTTYWVSPNGGKRSMVNICVGDSNLPAVSVWPALSAVGDSIRLNGTIAVGEVAWYTDSVGGISIGSSASGQDFYTIPLNATTYYAQKRTDIIFSYTEAPQQWIVPAGVTNIKVDIAGAKGGEVSGPAGKGGRVVATMNVTPGQIFYIYVGGQGRPEGGWNGGAAGHPDYRDYTFTGGGGGSDIRSGGTDLTNRLMVAGGGGGGISGYPGGDGGGLIGADGSYANCPGCGSGSGGSQSAGGGGGYGGGLGYGGVPGVLSGGNRGAAGGGGYYGGGGGTGSGGGGGGSNYTDPALCQNVQHTRGYSNGNGIVTISYYATCGTRIPISITMHAPSTITSFTPDSAGTGDTVVIKGTNYTGMRLVSFGGAASLSFNVVSDTLLKAVVGNGSSGAVFLNGRGGLVTKNGFKFISPRVNSVVPLKVNANTTVTIKGKHLSGTVSITFGGVSASFSILSDSIIEAQVITAITGNIVVSSPAGDIVFPGFEFYKAPLLTSISRLNGGTGDTIILTGTYFSGASAVQIGGVSVSSFAVLSDTTIRAIIGGGSTGNVSVTTFGGTSVLNGFVYYATPSITSFSPTTGFLGQPVIIRGSHFISAKSVLFGGTPVASFTVLSDSVISALPDTGTSGNIIVITVGGTAQLAGFTMTPPASIQSFSPAYGNTDDQITIKGKRLTGTSAVNFGTSAAASFVVVSDTIIKAVVGLGASGKISVTTPAGIVESPGFLFTAPPGNALSFDGTNDYMRIADNTKLKSQIITVELWVKPSGNNGYILIKPNTRGSNGSYLEDYSMEMSSGRFRVVMSNNGNQKIATQLSTFSTGKWYHVTGVFSPTTLSLYVNGILQQSVSTGFALDHGSEPVTIGAHPGLANYSNITIDEVRIFSADRSAFVMDDMKAPVNTYNDIVALYNFDQGIAGGNNAGNTFLVDQSINELTATLSNFGLSGAASNWVKSYAMSAPYVKAATNISSVGFRANWSAPLNTTFNNYSLYLSSDSSFSTLETGYNGLNVGNDTTYLLSGLSAGVTYYYKIAANLTALAGQGAFSASAQTTIPFATPVIASFTPDSSWALTTVTITGNNFTGATSVRFGDSLAQSFTVVSPTRITAIIKNGTSGSITVTGPAGTGALAGFTFIKNPVITSFAPTSAATGQVITITGTDFGKATTVLFGGKPAQSFSVISATSILATLGSGLTGDITVTTPAGTSQLAGFTYIPVEITGSTIICKGSNTVLTAAGLAPFTWYNAATAGALIYTGAQFISPVLSSDITYWVSANNGPRTQVNINVIDSAAPVVTATKILSGLGDTLRLTATTTIGNINWYTVASGGTTFSSVPSGQTIIVNPSVNTIYYAERVVEKVFNYTQSVQTWTVPAGVTSIKVDVLGAEGNSGAYAGGKGGRVQATMNVAPGQVLQLYVGGRDAWNGGGRGGFTNIAGGDASDIRLGGTSLDKRIIVAGGGGGSAPSGSNACGSVSPLTAGGAGGGLNGGDGKSCSGSFSSDCGRGGSQQAGGSPGSSYSVAGTAGSLGVGGVSGHSGGNAGGNGGGGYYGGGGATFYSANGGGGSSYTEPNLVQNVIHTQGYATGNGSISISYLSTCNKRTPIAISMINQPVISSFSPSVGIAGGNVVIKGANLLTTKSVSFGGIAVAAFTIIADTQVNVVLGTGASGSLILTSSGGTVIKSGFTLIPPPVINSFFPIAAVAGTTVAITGERLTNTTAITFGGIPAASFTVVSSTLINAVIGGGTNGSKGDITLTASNGIVSKGGFWYGTPQGNALHFDGSDDQITIPNQISGDFTIEYWMQTTQTGPVASTWTSGMGIVDAEMGGLLNDFGTSLVGNKLFFGIGSPALGADINIQSTSAVNTGKWIHVAATRIQSTGEIKLYINGTLEATTIAGVSALTSPAFIRLGSIQTNNNFYNGKLDEVRIWNIARSATDIKNGMQIALTGTETGLLNYFIFNQGIASGTNPTENTLTDIVNSNTPALNNFALTGATSNWVTSDAMNISTINSFTPTAALAGATITIKGTKFTGTTAVSFGGLAAASFTVISDTVITAVLSSASASGVVTITNNLGNATLSGFIFYPLPTISSFTPANSKTGTLVTITGTGFTSASSVKFGAVEASSFTVVSATTITAIVTAGSSGNIEITTPGGTATRSGFVYYPKPVISSFYPTSGGIGSVITLKGTSFNSVSVIRFGGINAASFTIQSDTIITAVMGAGASGKVSVSNMLESDSLAGFTALPSIVVRSFFPLSGNANDTITIKGANFTGTSQVKIGDSLVRSYTVLADSVVLAVLGGGISETPQRISIVSPNGVNGINGFWYGNISGNMLRFDGANDYMRIPDAPYLKPTTVTIEAWVNPGTANGIVISKPNSRGPGGSYFEDYFIGMTNGRFTATMSSISSVQKSVTQATAYTQGRWYHVTAVFSSTALKLYVDGVLQDSTAGVVLDHGAYPITIGAHPNLITYSNCAIDELRIFDTDRSTNLLQDMTGAIAPSTPGLVAYYNFNHGIALANNAGITSVTDYSANNNPATISNFSLTGTSSNWAKSYAMQIPILNSFYPAAGATGDTITLKGKNFTTVTGVTFGGMAATSFVIVSDSIMKAITGSGSTGSIGITTVSGYTARTGFTYYGMPTITSFLPANAVAGMTVSITGTNFDHISSVTFGDSAAASFTIVSPTNITAVLGVSASGNVKITSPIATVSKTGFGYLLLPTLSSFTPASALAADTVMIKGTNLSYATGVSFGGTAATSFSILSDTTMNAIVGAGSSGAVALTRPSFAVSKNAFWYGAAPGNALRFDGTNDFVTIPRSISEDFTIEYWIQTTQVGALGTGWVVGKGIVDGEVGGVANDFGTALVGNKLVFGTGDPATSSDLNIQSVSNINTGKWIHVAVTRVKTTGQLNLYINGVLEATGTGSTASLTSPGQLRVGSILTGNNFFNGGIDELKIWNNARTSQEINSDMQRHVNSADAHLVAYYTFNQGIAAGVNTGLTTLADQTANNNNGTLNNFALSGTVSNWVSSGIMSLPEITSFSPVSAATGATVIIRGKKLSGTTTVSFGGTNAASFTILSDSVISAVIAAGTSGGITVSTASGSRTIGGFTFIVIPAITSFSPMAQAEGGTITITGLRFEGVTNITLGGIPAASFNVVSPTSITAVVGTGASGNIVLTNSNGTATASGFVFSPPPTFTSFSPIAAARNTPVTIRGTNLAGVSAISFGGIAAASFVVVSDSVITALAGNALSGNVSITTPAGTVFLPGFTFMPPASVMYFTPNSGTAGTLVTLRGTMFNQATGVVFGNTPAASFTIVNDSVITAVLGNAGTGIVNINHPNDANGRNGFWYGTPPGNALAFDGGNDYMRIADDTLLKPATVTVETWVRVSSQPANAYIVTKPNSRGPAGTFAESYQIVLQAGFFAAVTSNNGVRKTAKQTTVSAINKWYHVAAIFAPDSVILYVNGEKQQATATGFAIDHGNYPITIGAHPNLTAYTNGAVDELRIFNTDRRNQIVSDMKTSINPNTTGLMAYYNFDQGASEGTNTGITSVADQTKNNFTAPLTNFALTGTTSNWVNSNAMIAPVIASFTPVSAAFGTPVTINGFGFTNVNAVTFGSTAALSFTINSDSIITAIVGPGTSGAINVSGTKGSDSRSGFNYPLSPTITNVSPLNTTTGSIVTITGTDFTGAATVSFGGTPATSFTVVSATSIRAIIGSGSSGSISVSTPGGIAAVNGFIFTTPSVITSFSPTEASPGDTIMITGTNFINITGVVFGGTTAAWFSVLSPTQIKAVLSGSGSSGAIAITTALGESSLAGFTARVPVISSFLPTNAFTGNTVTIKGARLSNATAVHFGGIAAASYSIQSDTQITAIVGSTALSGNISVTTNEETAVRSGFSYGSIDNMLDADGATDNVSISDAPGLRSTTITIETWVKPSNNTNGTLLAKGTGYGILMFSNTFYAMVNTNQFIGPVAYTPGNWYHLAVVVTSVGVTTIYVNGILALTGNTSTIIHDASPLVIGNSTWGNAGFQIDELRIFNTDRSTFLTSDMAGPVNVNTAGLVAYYDFNQGTDAGNNATVTTLIDKTANGNNGVLNGFALTGTSSNWIKNTQITRTVLLSSPRQTLAADQNQSLRNVVLSKFAVVVTNGDNEINALSATTAGTYLPTDITALKLWYKRTTDTLAGAVQIGQTITNIPTTGNIVTFSNFAVELKQNDTGYFFVTGDIAANAVAGNAIQIAANPTLTFTFAGTQTGTIATGGMQTFTNLPAIVSIQSMHPAAGNLGWNTTRNVIAGYQVSPAVAQTILSSVQLNTIGSYQLSDLQTNGFKLWVNTTNSIIGATRIDTGVVNTASGNTAVFSGLHKIIPANEIYYVFVTVDIASTSVQGNTIGISQASLADFVFTSGTAVGTDPISASVLHTIIVDPISNNTLTGNQTVFAGKPVTAIHATNPLGGNGVFTFTWIRSTVDPSQGYVLALGTNNTATYIPVSDTSAWYKRIVSSYGKTDTSNAVLISVLPTFTIANVQHICSGKSYHLNNHSYSASGEYRDTLYAVTGADSIIITQLNVNPNYSVNNPQSICAGKTYSFNSHNYAVAGTYRDTLRSITGCDSIIITQLNVNPVYSINNPQTICSVNSYSINGHTYTTAGTYRDTLHSTTGCDSIIVTQLNVTPTFTVNTTQTICYGSSYVFNGHIYTTNGTYRDTLGCTIILTQLTVNGGNTFNHSQSICSGKSYIINGHTYTIAGTYYDTLHTTLGCDSFVVTQLFVNPTYTVNNPQTICTGTVYTFNGHNYLTAGTYRDTLHSATGCDSIIVTQLSVNPIYAVNNPQTICTGTVYIFNGRNYSTAGTYRDTLHSATGCDSIIVTQLSVNPIYAVNNPQTICTGTVYIFNGRNYSTAGTYRDTLHSTTGCDSIIITQLSVNPIYAVNNPQTICAGTVYTFNGHTYSTAGNYNDTLHSTTGCDSIIITQLSVNPIYAVNNLQTICAGTVYIFNGHNYSTAGIYHDTLHSATGCDSIITTQITINAAPIATASAAGPTLFCTGGSVVINANNGSGLLYRWLQNNAAIASATTDSYLATANGNYRVITTNGNGCSDTSTAVTVTVNSKPATSAISGAVSPQINSFEAYSVVNTIGSTYNWIVTNGTLISGGNSNLIVVRWGATIGDASVKVIETNSTGCKSDTILHNTNLALPVKLISFTGAKERADIVLKWTTASELNNDYFIVQRSADGKQFENIGTVKGNGTTNSLSSYQYIDETTAYNKLQTTTFYRLKQVDFDGRFEYSKTVVVNNQQTMANSQQLALHASPNPFTDQVVFTVDNTVSEKATMRITDANGKMISEQQVELNEGKTIIDLGDFTNESSSGVYIVQIITQKNIATQRIVKSK
jgi:hypothetical protein